MTYRFVSLKNNLLIARGHNFNAGINCDQYYKEAFITLFKSEKRSFIYFDLRHNPYFKSMYSLADTTWATGSVSTNNNLKQKLINWKQKQPAG